MFIYTENGTDSDKRKKQQLTYNTKHTSNTQIHFPNPNIFKQIENVRNHRKHNQPFQKKNIYQNYINHIFIFYFICIFCIFCIHMFIYVYMCAPRATRTPDRTPVRTPLRTPSQIKHLARKRRKDVQVFV